MNTGTVQTEKKRVAISSKRQITIPQKFFSELGFESEAECILRGNEIILRPIRAQDDGDFSDLILEELLAEGYTGNALLSEFRKRQKKIRPAVEAMLEEADQIAKGEAKGYSYEDVFGVDNTES